MVTLQPVSAAGPPPTPESAPDATKYLPLALSAFVTFAVAIRLLAMAKFSTLSAGAVLAERGTTDVLVGTLLPAVPSLAIFGTSAMLALWTADIIGGTARPYWYLPLLCALSVLAGLLSPFVVTAVVFVLLGLVLLITKLIVSRDDARTSNPPRSRESRARKLKIFLSAVLGFELLVVLTQVPPWLPAELITLKHGAVVGYVLKDSPGRFIVMREADRAIVYSQTGDVLGRQICNPSSLADRVDTETSLIGHLVKPAMKYPDCPRKL